MRKNVLVFVAILVCYAFKPVCDFDEHKLAQQLEIAPFKIIENKFSDSDIGNAAFSKGLIQIPKSTYGVELIAIAGKYDTAVDGVRSFFRLYKCTEGKFELLTVNEFYGDIQHVFHDVERKEIVIALTLESDNCVYINLEKAPYESKWCDSGE